MLSSSWPCSVLSHYKPPRTRHIRFKSPSIASLLAGSSLTCITQFLAPSRVVAIKRSGTLIPRAWTFTLFKSKYSLLSLIQRVRFACPPVKHLSPRLPPKQRSAGPHTKLQVQVQAKPTCSQTQPSPAHPSQSRPNKDQTVSSTFKCITADSPPPERSDKNHSPRVRPCCIEYLPSIASHFAHHDGRHPPPRAELYSYVNVTHSATSLG